MTTICRFFNPDYSGSFSACAATHHVVFSPQKYCTSKVESGINKGYSALQITIRIVTFSESTSMQLTQGEIRNKEIPFRLADNSKRSELQMTKISRAASSKSLSVILEVKSGIKKCHSDLQITTRLPLTSWARIPFASAIRHKQIGFIFTANQKAHLVTFPCCLWIKQVGKWPSGPHGYLVVGARFELSAAPLHFKLFLSENEKSPHRFCDSPGWRVQPAWAWWSVFYTPLL